MKTIVASFDGVIGTALTLTYLSALFLIIAYATPEWVRTESGELQAGLWEQCACHNYEQNDVPAWLRLLQVLGAAAIFFLHVMIVLILVMLCNICKTVKVVHFLLVTLFICTAFLTTLMLFVIMVIGGIKFPDLIDAGWDFTLNYSYAFVVIAGATTFVAAVLGCIYMGRMTYENNEKQEEMNLSKENGVTDTAVEMQSSKDQEKDLPEYDE